jgi:hypothetical protein
VMVAADAPVAVSVTSVMDRHRFRGHSIGVDIRRLRRQQTKPGRDVVVMAHHLRRALAASGTAKPALLIVGVDSEWSAAPVVAVVAAGLHREGNAVLMADFSRESALARMFGTTERLSTVHAGPPASKLWLGSNRFGAHAMVDEWLLLNDLGVQADIILILATLDPAVGAGHFVELADTAVIVATAGRSSATALRSASSMIRAEGIQLHSVILVGADRDDETWGVLPYATAGTRLAPNVRENR